MLIGGLQKTTLIDFPGRVACTIFTIGCNFRCPFCHNKDLITKDLFKKSGIKIVQENDFFQFLEKRKKILDGVCITGGEPTLQPDLLKFCQRIKDLGLEVKLDSNGSNPGILKNLIVKKAVDFIAMDVKAAFNEYKKVIGVKFPIAKIKESIKLIFQSGLEYEFRTTMVPGIHNKKNMGRLAADLKKVTQSLTINNQSLNYFLQSFRPKNCLNPEYLKIKPFTTREIENMLQAVQKVLPQTKLKNG